MSTLITAPFGLVFDELVEVRVSAVNSINQGIPSAVNESGAQIRVIPGKAFTPTEGTATSQT